MKCKSCDRELTLDDLDIRSSHWQGGSLSVDLTVTRCKHCNAVLKENRSVYDTYLYKEYGIRAI